MNTIYQFKVFGHHDQKTLHQMIQRCKDERVAHGVLCADGHLGYSVPVGGVLAYEGYINVNGVGYDIACGNKAVRLDCDPQEVKKDIFRIMDEVQSKISFGIGRKNNEPVDHELFDDPLWKEVPFLTNLKNKAIDQLGTVGSGNHYVDIFIDELERIWVGVHFGSRGLGHGIASYFLKAGGGQDSIDAESVLFKEDSDLGEQYLKCMELAGKYAYAGRDWVCNRVAKILKGQTLESVHNHHNFAWKERHFDKDSWVIRKGATPAFPGQKGFVGGSMGDISVILEGVEHSTSKDSLYSTIHGAGRAMGRLEAKGKVDRKTGKPLTEGKVKMSDHEAWIKRKGVEVRGGDLDESPIAYKRIEEVLAAHNETIKVLHILQPIGVCMADALTNDPYKD